MGVEKEGKKVSLEEARRALQFRSPLPMWDAAYELAAYQRITIDEAREQLSQPSAPPHVDHFGDTFYASSDEFLIELLKTEFSLPHLLHRNHKVLTMSLEAGVRNVLDYGAGIGRLCALFSKFGVEAHHADIPGRLTKFAQWRYGQRNVTVPIHDVRALPDRKFDAISCFDVFEHLEDPISCVAALSSHLGLGGICFLTIDIFNFDWRRPGGHLPKNMLYGTIYRELCEEAGLSLVYGTTNHYSDAATATLQSYHRQSVPGIADDAPPSKVAPILDKRLRSLAAEYFDQCVKWSSEELKRCRLASGKDAC